MATATPQPVTAAFELMHAGGPVGRVCRATGNEAVSAVYGFDIELASPEGAPSAEAALGCDAALTVADGRGGSAVWRGIVARWDVRPAPEGGSHIGVSLVPRAWLLDRRPRTRSFRDLTAADLVLALTAGLRPAEGAYARLAARGGGTGDAASVLTQVNETDWALLTRAMARAGLGAVFVHAPAGEMLVVGDTPAALAEAAGEPAPRAVEAARAGLVRAGRLTLDAADCPVARTEWSGTSTVPGVCPGVRLPGAGGSPPELCIAAVRHTLAPDPESGALSYRAAYTALPPDDLLTAGETAVAPVGTGPRTGVVLGDATGETLRRAGDGRIAIAVPDGADATATLWAASAVPGAAPRPGTRVLWNCADDSPDAPVITGSLPQAPERPARRRRPQHAPGAHPAAAFAGARASVNEAPVPRHLANDAASGAFASESTTTSSGTGRDGKAFSLYVPSYNTATDEAFDPASTTYLRLGAANLTTSNGTEHRYAENENKMTAEVDKNADDPEAQGLEIEKANDEMRDKLDGWFDYTGGNHVSITMGNKEEVINGKRRLQINGGGMGVWDAGPQYFLDFSESLLGWKKTVASQASSAEFSWGDNQDVRMGADLSLFGGFTASGSISGALNYSVAGAVDVGYGPKVSYGKSNHLDYTSGKTFCHSNTDVTETHQSISLGVLDNAKAAENFAKHKSLFAGLQLSSAAVALGASLSGAGIYGLTREVEDGSQVFRGTLEGLATASFVAWAASMAHYFKYTKGAAKAEDKDYHSRIHLDTDQAAMMGVQGVAPMGYIAAQKDGAVFLGHMNAGTNRANAEGAFYVKSDGKTVMRSKQESFIAATDSTYMKVESSGNISFASKNIAADGSLNVKNGTLQVN